LQYFCSSLLLFSGACFGFGFFHLFPLVDCCVYYTIDFGILQSIVLPKYLLIIFTKSAIFRSTYK
jgi:hypothetical protein